MCLFRRSTPYPENFPEPLRAALESAHVKANEYSTMEIKGVDPIWKFVVPGDQAIDAWTRLSAQHAWTGHWPVLLGRDKDDVESILEIANDDATTPEKIVEEGTATDLGPLFERWARDASPRGESRGTGHRRRVAEGREAEHVVPGAVRRSEPQATSDNNRAHESEVRLGGPRVPAMGQLERESSAERACRGPATLVAALPEPARIHDARCRRVPSAATTLDARNRDGARAGAVRVLLRHRPPRCGDDLRACGNGYECIRLVLLVGLTQRSSTPSTRIPPITVPRFDPGRDRQSEQPDSEARGFSAFDRVRPTT